MLKLSWLLTLAILFYEMSAVKKKRYEEIKRGKCPKPRIKEKVRREVKMDKCPTELGVENTYLRERKKKVQSISSSPSFKRARKVCILSKEQK